MVQRVPFAPLRSTLQALRRFSISFGWPLPSGTKGRAARTGPMRHTGRRRRKTAGPWRWVTGTTLAGSLALGSAAALSQSLFSGFVALPDPDPVAATLPPSTSPLETSFADSGLVVDEAREPSGRGGARPALESVAEAAGSDDGDTALSEAAGAPDDEAHTQEASESLEVVAAAPPVGEPRPDVYVVADGDTVTRIAARFDLLPRSVILANKLEQPDAIRVGQRLTIPAEDVKEVPAPNPAAVASRPAARNSEAAFIQKLIPGAQASQRATSVPASITIAQAIHETAWGSSFLAREANNYFGIKAYSRPGPAGVVWIDAWEVEDGEHVVRQEPFRRYNDVSESLVEHGFFFHENRRYRAALEVPDDAREFARRIAAAGYATDPKYADKLVSYMDRYLSLIHI